MERRFVKSGIPGLDKLLGGGFLEGSVVTVGGPTGCGKSTLAMQFLYNGAIQYNEPGLYISIEESKETMLFHMSGYTWDIKSAEKEKKIIFLDYPIYEVDQFMDQYSAIQEIITSGGIKRTVVDSIMPVALFFKHDDERKKGFLKLVDNIRKWGTTTLIVSEDAKPAGFDTLPTTRYEIESFTDGWLNIYYKYSPEQERRVRFVEVLKMKGILHTAKPFPAEVGPEGFNIKSGNQGGPKPPPSTGLLKTRKPAKQVLRKPPKPNVKSKPVVKKKKTLGLRRRLS